jgi:hypothetical protein
MDKGRIMRREGGGHQAPHEIDGIWIGPKISLGYIGKLRSGKLIPFRSSVRVLEIQLLSKVIREKRIWLWLRDQMQ